MGILEPPNAPYLNWWFIVPKEKDSLVFIQDFQPVNWVTIQKSDIEPVVDEFLVRNRSYELL